MRESKGVIVHLHNDSSESPVKPVVLDAGVPEPVLGGTEPGGIITPAAASGTATDHAGAVANNTKNISSAQREHVVCRIGPSAPR
jgi:hypothetical protein